MPISSRRSRATVYAPDDAEVCARTRWPAARFQLGSGCSQGSAESEIPQQDARKGSGQAVKSHAAAADAGATPRVNARKLSMQTRAQTTACDELIKSEEALRLVSYPDPGTGGAPWTCGWGHTTGVHQGQVIDEAQAEIWYQDDVQDAVNTIYAAVPATVINLLPQSCYDALVSFVFNVGAQAFRDPKTGKPTQFYAAIVGNDHLEPARQMQRWVKGHNGLVLPGLVRRRGKEAAMWGSGIWVVKADQFPHGSDELATQGGATPVPPKPKPPVVSANLAGILAAVVAIAMYLFGRA